VAFQGAPTVTPDVTTPIVDTTTPETLPGSDASDLIDRPISPEEDTGGLPVSDVAEGGPVLTVQLTSSSIVSPTLVNGGEISYYDNRDGRFYTINKSGDVTALSDNSFPAASSVVFSESGSQAIIEFPDGSNIIYDFVTEKQTTLPSHWQDFAFSQNGSEVAGKSIGVDPNNRALVITSADGSKTQVVASLGTNANNVSVQFSPSGEIVAFSETGSAQSAFGRNEVYLIDRQGEAAGSLIVDGAKFAGSWSPDGVHLLYSTADSYNERPTLWYTVGYGNNIGAERIKIPLETWVEKCTFKDAAIAICAVPRTMVDHGGFDHRLVTAYDDVYQLNVTTGRSTLVGSPVSNVQMSNLNISDDGSILYFTDNFGRLNSMRLK